MDQHNENRVRIYIYNEVQTKWKQSVLIYIKWCSKQNGNKLKCIDTKQNNYKPVFDSPGFLRQARYGSLLHVQALQDCHSVRGIQYKE